MEKVLKLVSNVGIKQIIKCGFKLADKDCYDNNILLLSKTDGDNNICIYKNGIVGISGIEYCHDIFGIEPLFNLIKNKFVKIIRFSEKNIGDEDENIYKNTK